LPETVISVRLPLISRREQLRWTWRDGIEYRLFFPDFNNRSYEIVAGETTICSARLAAIREWSLGGSAVFSEGVWRRCGQCLRQDSGKVFAFWRPHSWFMPGWRASFDGVCRNGLPESLTPVLFGMILANIHPYNTQD
jgi:hypothetical protein